MLLLTPCIQKLVDYVLHNHRFNILEKGYFDRFWSEIATKAIFEETSKTDCGVNN